MSLDDALDRLSLGKVDFKAYMASREEGEQFVKSPSEYRQKLYDRINGVYAATGAKMPWLSTHDKFRFRPGEVTTWMGYNGHKKSMLTGYVAADLMRCGEKVAIASLEMQPVATLHRMAKQAVGGKLSEGAADAFLEWCEGKFWIYDQQGSVKYDTLIGVIYYCAEQLGVTHFFVDSLMKCVRSEEDYTGQKDFMDKVCSAAMELNIHIHVIHHSRKREDEKAPPGKMDAKGSGSIVDQTANFITIYQVHDDHRKDKVNDPTHVMQIHKQRNGEWEGSRNLYFKAHNLQFHEKGENDKIFLPKNSRIIEFA